MRQRKLKGNHSISGNSSLDLSKSQKHESIELFTNESRSKPVESQASGLAKLNGSVISDYNENRITLEKADIRLNQ